MRWATLLVACSFAAAAQDGVTQFQKYCSYCHGARGEGGRGPDLTSGRLQRGQTDDELFRVIRNGVPGTEMPAVRASDDEVRMLVAHVRSLAIASVPDRSVTGSASEGARLFKEHCASCHPGFGPDLRFAARRGPAFLRESIERPEAEIAPGYRAILIKLSSGAVAAGVRLNEDDLTVQIRDSQGSLRSFLKSAIQSIDRSKPSLMPSFAGRLPAKQVEDIIAHLMEMP